MATIFNLHDTNSAWRVSLQAIAMVKWHFEKHSCVIYLANQTTIYVDLLN